MGNNDQLIRFIIKNLVRKVEYDVDKDRFSINRIDISDELITRIVDEGAQYGLASDETRELISRVASDLQIAPFIDRSTSRTRVETLQTGSHLRLNFRNDHLGPLMLEALCLKAGNLFVLESNIPGIRHGDRIVSINKVWNISYEVDFVVFRNGTTRFPDEYSVLTPGKLESIDYFHQSPVYEILDAQQQFTKAELEQITASEPKARKRSENRYVWAPKLFDPIVFSLNPQSDTEEANATFLIQPGRKNPGQAKLVVNPDLDLSGEETKRKYVLQAILQCCTMSGDTDKAHKTEDIFAIETIKAGKIKKINTNDAQELWLLTEKPEIRIFRKI